MKKIRIIIAVIIAVLSIAAGLITLHITGKNRTEDVFSGTDITVSVDEYIKNQNKVKAVSADNAVFLKENTDVPFDIENEEFLKAVDFIKESLFNTVVLFSDYYSFGKESEGDTKGVIEHLRNEKLKVYLVLSEENADKFAGTMSESVNGIIVYQGEVTTEKFNSLLLKLKGEMLLKNKNAKLIAAVKDSTDISKFNKRSVHGILLEVNENADSQKLKKWNAAADVAGVDLIFSFDMKNTDSPDTLLKTVYDNEGHNALSMRAFNSFSEIKENRDNSFSSVEEFIRKGISPTISFRELGITSYDGETVETKEFSGEVEIYGSDLYPVYINGEKMSLGENGSRRLTFDFEEGLNEIRIEQCSEELIYKVNVSFDGDLLKSVTPEDEMTLYPKEKASVLVVGYYKADISVKVGTKEYKAKPEDKSATGYVAFKAKIKMPETREEVASLGAITVIGTYNGESMQLKGATIKPAEEKVNISNSGGKEEQPTAPIKLENYVPSLPGEIQQTLPQNILPGTTIGQMQTPSVITPSGGTAGGNNPPFTGAEMALITANYADTRPLIYNDDTYTPSCSALVKGTMDYIIQESEAYNKEYGEQVYFYELSSGVKVIRDHVKLVPRQEMGDNRLSVVSSSSENGTLKIKLSTSWKVPYTISFAPQSYYSQYGTKFNITDFTSDYIQLTFHHTVSADGNIDASGSNVISGASWHTAASDKKVSLFMPLRAFGEYYGCSVEYDEYGYMVITLHNKPQTLSGSVILLDPGHGGKDPGALGYGGAVEECDINLAVAYYTKQALEQRGAVVYSTRGADTTLELEDRKAIARSLKPDYFVSIHSNGSENKSMIGTATYYYKPFSKKLAANIYGEMLSVFKGYLYSGQPSVYDSISDGAPYYPFSVTRLDECPSVLIETGYVTNNDECYKLIQPQNQQLLGEAIAKGIEKTVLY